MKHMTQWLIATGAGVGTLPKTPGTWGSLIPVLLVLICGHFKVSPTWLIGVLLAIIVLASIATIVLAPWYTKYYERKDPPQVVCDEVAGQSIALLGMAWVAPNNHVPSFQWILLVLLAFALFRVFDVWKPFIINNVQQLSAGWGVLADDILAGAVAGSIVVLVAGMML